MNPVNDLTRLYKSYGYSQFKMSKFEEYDLYVRNKDFLVSNNIITFTDTEGKLMALKPDVTLSIIKNTKDVPGVMSKVFYSENVYRVSKGTGNYKEIPQVGLECIGDLDAFAISEALTLAGKSLLAISEAAVLDISSLSVLSSALSYFGLQEETEAAAINFISEKNVHELTRLLEANCTDEASIRAFITLLSSYGKPEAVFEKLSALPDTILNKEALNELIDVINALPEEVRRIVRIDFSVVSDFKYYNDIVFKGFIEGIPSSVLSGGQYGKLMKRMGRNAKAIGFALYLDLLTRFNETARKFDCDIALLYNKEASLSEVRLAAENLRASGAVLTAHALPEGFLAKEVYILDNGEVKKLEDHA